MLLKDTTLTGAVIGAAIEVHRVLGPGLLESAYEACLVRELAARQVAFERQVALPIRYKAERVDAEYKIDLLVGRRVVVELKSVDAILPVHRAQLLSYLRLGGFSVGLLINFNVPALRNGIVRILN